MSKKILLYGHAACPQVRPVRAVLKQAKIEYEYINIRADHEAAARVREINDGYESVPTIIFPDGSTLTEPSHRQLSGKLKEMGYALGPGSWIMGNLWLILTGAAILFALLRGMGLF